MPHEASSVVAELHTILDQGFRRCRSLAEQMQIELGTNYADQLELLYIGQDNLKPIIRPWFNEFYKTMTRTLFDVLKVLQPEHFEDGKKVNFYFLPGYHSHLISKRIFFQEESEGGYKSFGIGLCGDLQSEPEHYHDCCHARWYHYATTPPRPARDFLPASPYHWFAYQQPRVTEDDRHHLVASVTFSVDGPAAEEQDSREHRVLDLSACTTSTMEWGGKVAQMLNSMEFLNHKNWEFPDRGDRKQVAQRDYDEDREEKWRQIRLLLISLWMHSVFKACEPEWWDILNKELQRLELSSMSEAISRALADEVARDWGDSQTGRPGFITWTIINLHPLIAPPPAPIFCQRDHATRPQEASTTYQQTIGWATMFCSAPLKLPFIAVVRQWIRTIYSMLRSAEVTVLLSNREPYARAAQIIRMFSHESHRFMEEPIQTVLRNVSNCDEKRIAHRKHIIQALRVMHTFTYMISSAPRQGKLDEERADFLKSLNVGSELLVGCVYSAARDVKIYRLSPDEKRASIVIPEEPAISDKELSGATYVYCLLLVGEMVRNYAQHGPPDAVANLNATVENKVLTIWLEGRVTTRPASQNFAILDNLLEALRVGHAKIEEINEELYRWRVTVKLTKENENEAATVKVS